MKRLIFILIAACLCPAVFAYTLISKQSSAPAEHSYAMEAAFEEPALYQENTAYVEPFVLPMVFEDPSKQEKLRKLALSNSDVLDIAKTKGFYPEKYLEWLINDPSPKVIEFLKAYPDAKDEVTGGLSQEECDVDFPHFLQYDKRWAFYPYGETIMANGGCGPTALSMVAVALTGNMEATPNALADYSVKNGYYVKGKGTAWNLFSSNITEFGIKGRVIEITKDSLFSSLDSGHPIIVSLRPGEFTDVGHIIVIIGHEGDNLIIRDPGSTSRTEKLWSYDRLVRQVKGVWEYSRI